MTQLIGSDSNSARASTARSGGATTTGIVDADASATIHFGVVCKGFRDGLEATVGKVAIEGLVLFLEAVDLELRFTEPVLHVPQSRDQERHVGA